MPLPPALAAKLAKRGLVSPVRQTDKENRQDIKVALSCPNKYNIYHECTTWCQIHWKAHTAPEPRYLKNIRKLIEKYPLPKNCTELFDNGIRRYYYWDMEKNLVSWLPPNHPKAVQSEPAAKLRLKLNEINEEQHMRDIEKRKDKHRDRKDKDRDEDRRYKHDDRERSRRRNKRDDLDPMDPAAYSDIPRGNWSDGLENNKSKADTTASGALFQQRPYPSPGDVLEANKQKTIKKK